MGTLSQVKTQSAKICLNFNLGGEGGYSSAKSKLTKCQDLPKFQFSGHWVGYSQPSQNSKCQDLAKFQFFWAGAGTLSQVKTQSAKICLNFNFFGGVVLSAKSELKVPRSA